MQNDQKSKAYAVVFRFVKENLWLFGLGLLCSMLNTAFNSLTPQIIRMTVDSIIGSEELPGWFTALGLQRLLQGDTARVLLLAAAAVLAAAILSGVFSFLARINTARASENAIKSLRDALYGHIQKLPFSWHTAHQTGEIIQRCTSDVEVIRNFVSAQMVEVFRIVFLIVMTMAIMFSMNVKISLVVAVFIPIIALYSFFFSSKISKRFMDADIAEGKLSSTVQENLTGVRVVRAFGKEASEVERFEQTNGQLTGLQLKVGHLSALTNPLTYVLINLAIVALLWTGAIEINVGSMASGDLIALVNYMNQILVELVKLANLIVQISKALASAGRIHAVLETKPGMAFPAAITGQADERRAGEAVRFDHVGLTYAGAGAPSLTGITFTARQGETIGVIGGTGAGKSSLVHLIPRFYDATEGSVELFGRPAAAWPRELLRSRVGIVMQKAQLFTGTIRSNLLWGDRRATDAELWAALETAQAAGFVRAKPLGLDEPVEQGGQNFSGGQRQRLTIARALVAKPDILILDDSASALDFATDAALRKAIAALPGSMTVFIVSQRAASLQHADRIIVLDDGHMVGCGTHQELLARCPVYQEIYASQFKKPSELVKGGAPA